MIIKEKVYISVPQTLHRDKGRGQPVRFSSSTRWEGIIGAWAPGRSNSITQRGGGSQTCQLLPSIQNKQIISNFPSIPAPPNLNFSFNFNQ